MFCEGCLDLKGPCPQCGKDLGGVSKQPRGLIKERRRHGAKSWEEYYEERQKEKAADGGDDDG